MNKHGKSKAIQSVSKYILTRFFLSLTIYTIALLVAFGLAWFVSSRKVWYKTDELYRYVLHPVNEYKIPVVIICWLVGFIVLFLIYWNKTLEYIDAVAQASSELTADDDELIRLPAELKQMQDDMNQIKQDARRNARLAKEEEQRKNDLVVYLAHDLKTPLTSVIGYLSLLQDEPDISAEVRGKYTSVALDKALRLEDLINEFFEITRFNLSRLTLETSRINLTRMLEQTAYEFRPVFAKKNISYSLEAEPDLEIKCDADKLQRVFDNLFRNGAAYSFENSEIRIAAEKKPDGVTIRFLNHGNTIPEEKLQRIFEQFYRLDSSRATRTGGAGLGLTIAKKIVELHGGTITASSENEQIIFTVFLPELP